MTASTLHRLMLAGEFVFYLLLGLGLTARCGWVWQQAVGLALILMVGVAVGPILYLRKKGML